MSNQRNIGKNIVTLLLCTVMSACTGFATTQSSPFPSTVTPQIPEKISPETATPTVITLTMKPLFTLTNTAESTRKPTSTPLPSQTATISLPIETPGPQSILTEQVLPLNETQIASFSSACDDPNKSTSLSPKGNWLAVSCGYKRDQTLQIYSKTGKKWEVQFKDYIAKEFITGDFGVPGNLYPVQWTSDEMYLYFTSAIGFSGGGTCFYGGNGQGLYRLNLGNGTVAAALPPLKGAADYIISFSPDGRWLAYTAGIPTILNLHTGIEIALQGRESAGDFTWSPDSSNLAYSACQTSEDFMKIKKSSIRIFSLDIHQSKTILEIDSGFLRIDSGNGNRMLKIYDAYINHPDYLFFDWSTEQLITPAPTTTP